MSDEIKSGLVTQMQPVIESIIASPKVAMAIGTATAGVGMDVAFFNHLPTYMGYLATMLGLILTSVLIYRNVMLTIMERKEYKIKIMERLKALETKAP
jgi:hypothetical protein